MTDPLETISASTIKRYSDRLHTLGTDVRTLGWGSEYQQRLRFAQVLRSTLVAGRSVLDIGCGFGDLKTFLDEMDSGIERYTGWDINAELIQAAAARHTESEFQVVDLLSCQAVKPTAEVGIMLGLLNFNLKDTYDNVEYSKRMIDRALQAVTETLVVDFLSSHKAPDYPSEDFVFYHDPTEMLSFALTKSSDVALLHDYAPIPQKEFMLILRK
jgi:SAM-dependent methyltransferase